jgi:hypothetical protein
VLLIGTVPYILFADVDLQPWAIVDANELEAEIGDTDEEVPLDKAKTNSNNTVV